MKELLVKVENGVKSLEILQGAAKVIPEPLNVDVAGTITAPANYLEKRIDVILVCAAHVLVNQNEGTICLVVDEKNKYKDTIKGSLTLNPDFEKFGINKGVQRDTFDLADFIKMNRFFFVDKNVALKLISELKNFKAKVNKQIENSTNDRGNSRFLQDQIVESNIPESFDLSIPIFKGEERQVFKVEININSSNFSCTLISPDVKDLINEFKADLVNKQVDRIQVLCPELLIVNV